MAHTRTWNAAYEADPANSDDALEGAQRIRELKVDVKERLAVDHVMDETDNDGKHNKVTMPVQASAPAQIASTGILYTKDVSSKAELFFRDEDGNEVQLTTGGDLNQDTPFPAGTRMLFQQETAPTGWTIDTTLNNAMLRLVDGSTQTFETVASPGGSDAFTTAFNSSKATESHTLTAAQSGLPAHDHDLVVYEFGGVKNKAIGGDVTGGSVTDTTGVQNNTAQNASQGHSHNITLDPTFCDVIVCTKDA